MFNRLKRIWMYEDLSSQGARILMRGVAEGLHANGHEVHVFEVNHMDATVLVRMKEDLLSYKPDAIFLANHPVRHLLKQIDLDSVDCPVFVWLFDDPLIMGKERFMSNEVVLVADPSFIDGAKERGANSVYFVPVAAPEKCSVEVKDEYAFPVVYAGSIFVDRAMRENIEPRLLPVVRELIQQKLLQPQKSFEYLLERINTKKLISLRGNIDVEISLSYELRHFLYTECNRNWRLQFLKALEPLSLHVFGNAAWRPYIKGTLLADRFHRPINAFTEYPSLIKSAKINININSLQGFSAPTLRDFQVPFFEGFQLSAALQKHRINWEEHDAQNRFCLEDFPWSDSSDSPEGMHDLTKQLLEDNQARIDWVQYAKEEIEQHHTFAHRIEQLNNLLQDNDVP